MRSICCAVLCLSLLSFFGQCKPAYSADFNTRLSSAVYLLIDKGYIADDRVRSSNTFGAVDESALKALDRAVDSFDMDAAHAIGWLHKNGIAVNWAESVQVKETEKTKESSTVSEKDRWKHILEQVYGKGGQGYVFEEEALSNPKLNKELVEVYRASEVYPENDGWYSLRVEIGTIGETQISFPIRLNVQSGQVIEYPENGAPTMRQLSPLATTD